MNDARYYVTTSIPYVNARPHIGFALECVQADALARHHRLRDDDTRFLSGTDDNALKNVQAAAAEGLPTQALVDRNAAAIMQTYPYRRAIVVTATAAPCSKKRPSSTPGTRDARGTTPLRARLAARASTAGGGDGDSRWPTAHP